MVAKPGFRVVINERVCEGCGDCGDKSNCLSVQPVDTPYGRKTRIHQTSCNFDMSCLQGDCPAFATVTVDDDGPRSRHGRRSARPAIPAPGCPTPAPVVPTDELHRAPLGHRRHRRDHGQPGARHGGDARRATSCAASTRPGCRRRPVRSSATCASAAATVPASNHANSSGVDCLLAFDLLVAASDTHRVGADADRTVVVGSVAPTPTGAMVAHPTTPYPELAALTGRLDEVSRAELNRYVDAAAIADRAVRRRHDGQHPAARRRRAGRARVAGRPGAHRAGDRAQRRRRRAQRRRVPLGPAVGVVPTEVEQAAGHRRAASPETLDELIDRLADDLVGYQSAALRRALPSTSSASPARPSSASTRRARRSPRPSPATATS